MKQTCPQCLSDNLTRDAVSRDVFFHFFIDVTLTSHYAYHCRACGHTWFGSSSVLPRPLVRILMASRHGVFLVILLGALLAALAQVFFLLCRVFG